MDHASRLVGQAGLFGHEEVESLSGREVKERALEDGRALMVRYRGRVVDERLATDACHLVGIYARFAGQSVQRFNVDGSPSESLKRVVGALVRHPEVTFDAWATVVQVVLANPWWDGSPSIGVVFGPGIVERNLDDPAHGAQRLTALQRADREKAERTRRRLDFARAATA